MQKQKLKPHVKGKRTPFTYAIKILWNVHMKSTEPIADLHLSMPYLMQAQAVDLEKWTAATEDDMCRITEGK